MLALSLSVIGQVSGQGSDSKTGHGVAYRVGVVDVRILPESTSDFRPPSISSSVSASDPVRLSAISNISTVSSPFGFNGINAAQSGSNPPDTQVAAGPNYLVEMVNVLGAVYTRQGALVQTRNLYQLFKAPGDNLADPKVLFDNSSQRWFASIITSPSSNFTPGNVTVAVSTNIDPFTWNVYNLCPGQGGTCPSTTYLPDQPILGVSDDKVVISVNDYTSCCFVGAQYWVLNKSQMLSGAQSVSEYSHGPDGRFFSIHPVQSLSSTTTQYMVTTGTCCSSNVTLFSITGVPPGTVANNTVSLPIATMTTPPQGVQPLFDCIVSGGKVICFSNPIDLHQSNRVLSAVWFKGTLWYSANDGCTPPGDSKLRSCVRLTQINTGTKSVTEDFDYGANSTYYFYPAASMDGRGNLDVIYGYSSSTVSPSLALTGQSVFDQSGALAPALTIKAGNSSNPTGRYGDYFGAAVDPSNSTIVWIAGEYGNTANGPWATFIANMNLHAKPFFNMSTNPSSMTIVCNQFGCDPGQSVSSTLTITSVNGFSGTVTLSYIPPGSNCCTTLTGPSSANVPLEGTVTATITAGVLGTKSATYVWTIDGSSGGFTTSTTLTITYFFCKNCL